MTYSLRACARALLSPKRFARVSEIRERPSLVPAEPGVYGWWFSSKLTGVPTEGTQLQRKWRLLYIGIAPSGPTSARRPRTLRSRIKNHCRGPAASSTLRRTLACLLKNKLKLDVKRQPSGKLWMSSEDEMRLTEWMDAHARVAWICHPEPWQLESQLIARGKPRLPLNIRGSRDPFGAELKVLRAAVGRSQADARRE
jgi:hypothetical protein